MTQEPIRVGDVEVAVVCEGYAPLELSDEMPGALVDWAAERSTHPWAFHDEATWAWHVHAFALRTPDGVVMVDTGLGTFPPVRPWAEAVDRDEALAAAQVDPAEVRAVVHTHLHADHAGGAVVEGRPRFPNAVHHAHPADWEHFGHPDRIGGFTARGPMAELQRLGALDLTERDHEVVPGVRVVQAPGHTPGHRVVVLDAGAASIVLTGDLLHVPVQVARPEVPGNHDVDADLAARSRVAVLQEALRADRRVAVSHFGRPFGRVDRQGWRSEP